MATLQGLSSGDFTDLHGHFLPSVDDGPKTNDDALRMLDGMAALGYTRVCVTPHCYPHRFPAATAAAVSTAYDALCGQRGQTLPELGLGSEQMFDPGLLGRIDAGTVRTLNGSRYLLLEFPQGFNPAGLGAVFYRIRLLGKVAVLAHPERWPELMARSDVIEEIIQRQSALLQLDLLSLVGKHGRAAKKAGQLLLKTGAIHLVASDAHTTKDISRLEKALGAASKLTSVAQFRRLAVENPRRIWGDESVSWGDI